MPTLLYVRANTGQLVEIPWTAGPFDLNEVTQRLVDSGIPLDQFPNVSVSMNRPVLPPASAAAESADFEVGTSGWPTIPKPDENRVLPDYSEVAWDPADGVSLQQKLGQGYGGFNMKRGDSDPWVDVMSLPKSLFMFPWDYEMLHSDRVTLNVGKRWKLVDQQNVSAGERYNYKKGYKTGVTEQIRFEVGMTLGYEGSGVSAELSFTFLKDVKLSREETSEINIQVNGVEGKEIVFGAWQKTECTERVIA